MREVIDASAAFVNVAATQASSRDLQNDRSRVSSDAASVSVMAYGISNTEE